jgi:ubiquinone/menaquinone biosynthesis C-methylase UbiE
MNITIGAWRVSIEKNMPQLAELAKTYDATKWYWNSSMHRLIFGRAYRRLFAAFWKDRRLMNLQNGSKILDAGIGAGVFSESLMSTTACRYRIFGIDISEQILGTARRNLSRYDGELHLERGDLRQLPFGDGEMDLVISGLALEHAHDPRAAIREMTRVLRSGSNLILVVTLPYAPDFITRLIYRYTPLPARRLEQWMEEAGLTDIERYRLSGLARVFGHALIGKKG